MQLIFLNQSSEEVDKTLFEWVLERVTDATHEDVELLITTNEEIQKLNKEYRQKDKPTDVLSFSLDDPEHLGQIIISIERATEQAADIGQSLEEELKFLFCHGVLHLLGYDHENAEDEEKMLKKAYEVLERD
jgi:probable rRNA maturation factor